MESREILSKKITPPSKGQKFKLSARLGKILTSSDAEFNKKNKLKEPRLIV
jgi:hypothetical protein